jgi:pimeloyl-ACP methyl ester carboxylesterase
MKNLTFLVAVCFMALVLKAQNYDESKVPTYTLPDPLKTTEGKMITDKAAWERMRKPEILSLFEYNVYGQMPEEFDSLNFAVTNESVTAMGGKANMKEIDLIVWESGKSVTIHLVMFIPNKTKKPVPVFLLINNRGKENTDPTRTVKSEFWPAEMVVDSGYAIVAFHVSDAAPDNKDKYHEAALQLYPRHLRAEYGMKAIGAWAWAASRVLDYFEMQQDVDAKKVVVVGHSRGGKAALWAGAQDQRFAMVVSNCSGNTGAALSRRKFGETVKAINTSFPHWFCDAYKKYNDKEDSLPVDQHMLLALIAPRPLYVTNATKDQWADPTGTYLSLYHASKVYALYDPANVLPAQPPAVNKWLAQVKLGYHNREGVHNLTAFDWSNFIRFAKLQFRK